MLIYFLQFFIIIILANLSYYLYINDSLQIGLIIAYFILYLPIKEGSFKYYVRIPQEKYPFILFRHFSKTEVAIRNVKSNLNGHRSKAHNQFIIMLLI